MTCLSEEHDLSHSETLDYYVNRASAGLIVTEPALISPLADFSNCPGIYCYQQVKSWRKITEAVHDRNGKIFLQLWYCGDLATPCLLGKVLTTKTWLPNAKQVKSNSSNKRQISAIVRLFRCAAQNALAADFDGVEIHAAFGYLIESNFSNKLKPIQELEQRMELLNSIIEEVASIWDEQRVGIRISPEAAFLGENVTDIYEAFSCFFDIFEFYNLGYVHLVEPNIAHNHCDVFAALISFLRSVYHGSIISSCHNSFEQAQKVIARGNADLVSFDRLIAC